MKKTTFKTVPFNIELAKKITNNEMKGKIMTKNGRDVRIICFDRNHDNPILALIPATEDVNIEMCYSYNINGETPDSDCATLVLQVPFTYIDYSNYKPEKWETCLVRHTIDNYWQLRVCSGENIWGKVTFFEIGGERGITFEQYLPFNNKTKYLFGSYMSLEEMILKQNNKE